MKTIHTYTHLEKQEKAFGLEVMDFLLLAVIYALVFIFSVNLVINLSAVGGAYLLLRIYKKGKPPKYTTTLIRFLALPKHYTLPGKEVL